MDDTLIEKSKALCEKIERINRRRMMVIVVQAILTMVSVYIFPMPLNVILIILMLFITLFYLVATHKHINKLIEGINGAEEK